MRSAVRIELAIAFSQFAHERNRRSRHRLMRALATGGPHVHWIEVAAMSRPLDQICNQLCARLETVGDERFTCLRDKVRSPIRLAFT